MRYVLPMGKKMPFSDLMERYECAVALSGVFISDKERAMENEAVDDRPMEEKLREAFAGLSTEELQAIIDDDLRSEETKAIARELLQNK